MGERPINQCVEADEDFHAYEDEEAYWAIDLYKHALEPGKMVTYVSFLTFKITQSKLVPVDSVA